MKIHRSAIIVLIAVAGFLLEPLLQGQSEKKTGEGLGEPLAASPVELLERGQNAFQQNDFSTAEKAFDQFFTDYGENPDAQEAMRLYRPFLALAKIGVGKYGEALVLIDESLALGRLKAQLEDELSFWRAICLMQAEDYVAAQEAFGEYWVNEKHSRSKRHEALLLFAGLYLMQDFDQVAADFLKEQIPKIRKQAPEVAGRAVVLRLRALMKLGDRDQALELLRQEYPNLDKITQVVSFQLQALDLGARFIEQGQYRNAIFCLQRVWPKQKLLGYQKKRLEELRGREEKMKKMSNQQAASFQLKAVIRRIEREISQLEQVEHFDSGLRLRLGIAFQSQERYREAALVMEEMLRKMPPDPVVDSASLALIQCWMQIERWPKAIEASDLYLKVFGDWDGAKHIPEVMFMKGEAYRQAQEARQAAMAYGDLVESFPEDKQAPAALFMQAYMYLVQDDTEGAVYHFDQLRQRYPKHPLIDDADYWTAMTLSFSSEYAEARERLQSYLKKYSKRGKYLIEAEFRLAYCVFALGDTAGAIDLFRAFIAEHDQHALLDEIRLLLGDAYLGEGKIEQGIASYRKIDPRAKRFYEDGWFKIGKAYRLTGQLDEMRAHFEVFLKAYPASSRMPEAVYWVGWVDRQNGDIARAKQVYWEVLKVHGNDPDMLAIEDLLAAMPKLFRDSGEEGEEELLTRLQGLQIQAKANRQRALALRCAWGIAQVYRGRDDEAYKAALLAATPDVDGKRDQARIVVDCAEAQLAMENFTVAGALYEQVRKWHPSALERDRVFAGLGRIAESKGEIEKAIGYYEKCERATASSQRLGEIKLQRARLLAELGRGEEALLALNDLLEDPTGSSRSKAQALFESGEVLMNEEEPLKAAAYYERIYVVYGKYRDLVARAYWRRGEALEKLAKNDEAREVYEELLGRDDLKAFGEVEMAAEKLKAMPQREEEL